MDRRRTGIVAGALALTALLALVVVSAAGAVAFADEPCRPADPTFLCPSGVVERSYSVKMEAKPNPGTTSFSYTLLSGSPPPGITLQKNGLLTGTPTQAGTGRFWVLLESDQGGGASDREFSITIDPRVLVTTQCAPSGTTGAPYSLGVTAAMKTGPGTTSPPSSPLQWTLTSGQLPPGLTLGASDGVISGTPTTEGSYPFVVRAALTDGRADTKALQIDVRAPLAITAPPARRSEISVPFQLALAASGGSGTYAWTLTSGTLPRGVTLATTGTIAGTPLTAGTFPFTATATDTEGRKADYPSTLTVASKLAISTRLLRPAKVGRAYRQKIVTTGGVVPKVLRVTKGPLPRGIRFDRVLGVLSGTPTRPGTVPHHLRRRGRTQGALHEDAQARRQGLGAPAERVTGGRGGARRETALGLTPTRVDSPIQRQTRQPSVRCVGEPPPRGSMWRSFEGWVGTRSSGVALFVVALAGFGLQSVVLPVGLGRDMGRYVQTFRPVSGTRSRSCPRPSARAGPSPRSESGSRSTLGSAAAEIWLATLYAASIVAWCAVARLLGARAAILTAALLLVYPGYGILFHGLASDALFAAAFAGLGSSSVESNSPSVHQDVPLSPVSGWARSCSFDRPNQVLIVMALLPFALHAPWRLRVQWAVAFFVASAVVTQGWKGFMTLRYGDVGGLRPSGAVLVTAFALLPLLVPAPVAPTSDDRCDSAASWA